MSGWPRSKIWRYSMLIARDFYFEAFRQRVDDGNADPMQAARGLIGFLIEFAARVQRGHDDFERRFLREISDADRPGCRAHCR